ncbi:MAG: hypothetical protein OXE94_00680 [Aestuariivita sp.]|nr:hypothetical protein [Aestuariivita sp.]MCY4202632.1 hypothetical protein [Aestuariivita sp.]
MPNEVKAQLTQADCLPGYTLQEVPLPGAPSWMSGATTQRCVANWTGSAPNIESADPTRRSTVILSLAGPGTVNGCGPGHETRINIRATGGFFAVGQSSTVRVRVSKDFTNDGFDFQSLVPNGSWANFEGSITVFNVSEGDNVVGLRHVAGMPMNSGKHSIRLELEDFSLNAEKTWMEPYMGSMTQKYRIAPTGGIIVTFDLDGPGCM